MDNSHLGIMGFPPSAAPPSVDPDFVDVEKKGATTETNRPTGPKTSSQDGQNDYTESRPSSVRGIETSPKTALHRGLQARHIAMIAMGGALGTGLLIGTGKALSDGGPAAVLISYTLIGLLVYIVMTALGEISAWLPMSAGFTGYASRFADPALGFALGWTYWCKYVMVIPNQLIAGAMVLEYWVPREKVNPAVWVAIFLVLIIIINYFGVKFFGEFEFWLSSFKIVAVIVLIITLICITSGAGKQGPVGFKYWGNPGSFRIPDGYEDRPNLGRFLSFWKTICTACFAYLGTELVGVTVGEAQNPRRTVPRAIRLTFYRILVFYVGSVLLLGMCVPYNSIYLSFKDPPPEKNDSLVRRAYGTGSSASPFVAAAKEAGIAHMPTVINFFIIVFVFSAANSDLYIASRTLYGLASDGYAPRIFKRTDKRGLPIWSLMVSSVFGCLAFMCASQDATQVFDLMLSITTIFGMLSWISILYTHICFVRGRRAVGIPNQDMPYVAPFGLWGSIIALFFCILIAVTKNFDVFIGQGQGLNLKKLLLGLIGIPVYLFCILFWKSWKKEPRVTPETIDFYTGKDIIDEEERRFLEDEKRRLAEEPANWWVKVYRKYISWLF